MDSRSRRLPFCLPNSRPSYASGPLVSGSSLGSSRLHSRETVLSSDRFPRQTSSSFKGDQDRQSSRLLSHSKDYSSDSASSSWKLPSSLTSSSRSYERPWADYTPSSRSQLSDSEGRLGMRSGLLNASDDGDYKRAKLTYSSRGLYSKTAGTSVTGSIHSSNGLNSGRGTAEKHGDSSLSSRSLSSSSKPLTSWRELEKKKESSLSGLQDRRSRTSGLTSSLYHTDRVTSTYAQGARPKETTFSPSSSPAPARETCYRSSSSSHWSSPLGRDIGGKTVTRSPISSSGLHSTSQEQTPRHISSSHSPHTPCYVAPPVRAEAPFPPRPAPEAGESEGRCSTRRLLSRLFSRRSSQDSSSGSSSARSADDDSRSTGGESVDSDEGARMSSLESDSRGSLGSSSGLRHRRVELTPIQETHDGYRGLLAPSAASQRDTDVNNGGGGGSSSSWLSSSLRGRCPPLLSRLRRHARDESTRPAASSDEGYALPQRSLRSWDVSERGATREDDDDEDEEEGAVGVDFFRGAGRRREDNKLPDLDDAPAELPPRRRNGAFENISASSPPGAAESELDGQKDKPAVNRHQEKLRLIKEKLLLEDSDDEERDLCRICQMEEESASNPLIQPCRCTGSLQFVHQECIKRWLCSKIGSGTNLEAITNCELCKEKLRLNIDNFDIQELYRTHVQSEYDEFISSGLYLVVLLHFCEQRLSDVLGAVDAAGLFNLVRILPEHMDNLGIPRGESDEEVPDSRPSIEFSDLDDDLEEEY